MSKKIILLIVLNSDNIYSKDLEKFQSKLKFFEVNFDGIILI